MGTWGVRGRVVVVMLALVIAGGCATLPTGSVRAAGTFPVSDCTGTAMQTAVDMAQAAGGGTVQFACSGTLSISTITVTTALTLDATGQRVVLDGGGGLLFSVVPGGSLSLNLFTLTNGGGSAIFNRGTVYLTNSTIRDSTTTNNGGAVYNGGSLYVTNCLFLNNAATFGGGAIYNRSGGLIVVENSTFTGNSAPQGTGGGAVANAGVNVTLRNVTISGNSGNGIAGGGGGIAVGNSLIVNNTPSDTSGTVRDIGSPSTTYGTFTFAGSLGDNGGPTQTLPIDTASPAYNAGIACPQFYAGTSTPLTYDQRGATRGFMPCSRGAFEPGSVNVARTLTATRTSDGAPLTDGSSVPVEQITLATTVRGVLGEPITGGTADFLDRTSMGTLTDCSMVGVQDGATSCGSASVAQGSNVYSSPYTPATGSPYAAGSTPTFTLIGVNATQTSFTAHTPNPSAVGQVISFTVQVTETSFTGSPSPPIGTVTLTDVTGNPMNPTPFASGMLTNGSVTLMYSGLPAGARTIRADYSGSSQDAASASTTVTQTVLGQTSTALTTNPNPATFGQGVTLNAVVTGNAGTPTGTVTFTDVTDAMNPVPLGSPVTLDGNGKATVTVQTLPVGTRQLRADYPGDARNAASTGTASQTVNQASGIPTVASSASPVTYGTAVTFTATVATATGAAAAPTGTVQFAYQLMGGAGMPIAIGSAVALDMTGKVTSTAVTLPPGTYTVTAAYSGDANYAGASGTVGQTVTKAIPVPVVMSSNASVTCGTGVSYTATVPAITGGATPTGSITFAYAPTAGGMSTPIGTAVTLDMSGKATSAAVSFPTAGSYTITASYSGDTNYTAASGTVGQTVTQATSTVNVASSNASAIYGTAVTFTTTVPAATGGATPTGSVSFAYAPTAGGMSLPIGTAVTLDGIGKATSSSVTLPPGSYTITATYSGDTNYVGANGTVGQTITQATPTPTATSSAASATYGTSVTFTASVPAVGTGTTPTGTVSFTYLPVGGTGMSTPIGMAVALDMMGTATSAAVALPPGSYTVTAIYNGNANYANANGTVGQTVTKATPTPTVTSSAATVSYDTSVTFSATVPAITGGATPTGSITFAYAPTAGGMSTSIGTAVTLDMTGKATSANVVIPVGTYTVTATYSGDTNYVVAFATVSQTVTQATPVPTVTSSNASVSYGTAVTFTGTVPKVGTGNVPTGSITFAYALTNGGMPVPIGTAVTLDGSGKATSASVTLPPDRYTVTAKYGGDANYVSASGTTNQSVTQATPTPMVTSSVASATYGTSVTFSATVPNVGTGITPTGSVTFAYAPTAGGMSMPIGTAVTPDMMGKATSIAVILPTGSYTVTATYSGDTNYVGANGTVGQMVTKTTPTVTATSSAPSVPVGVPFTIAATVAKVTGGVFPTGSVIFTYAPTAGGMSTPIGGAITLDATGKATSASVSLPTSGSYTVTVAYNGDTNYAGASGTASETITAASVTALTVAAPAPGAGNANTGTSTAPRIRAGVTLPLTLTATYTDGSNRTITGAAYTGFDPEVVAVDAMGNVTGIAAGSTTITVSYPDGKGGTATTTISVGVTSGTGGGLIAPQPGGAPSVPNTSGATPQAQPTRHAEPTAPASSGVQPKAAPTLTPTPDAQPARR